MKLKKTFRFFTALLAIFSLMPHYGLYVQAQEQQTATILNYSQTGINKDGDYAQERIIVSFKPGQSKQAIQKQVERRTRQAQNPVGFIVQKIGNLSLRVSGEKLPEEKLERIENFQRKFDFEEKPLAIKGKPDEVVILENKERKAIDVEEAVEDFSQLPEVEFAEPDYKAGASFIPNDEYYPYQWSFPKIEVESAWDVVTGDNTNSVYIAVLDTGISNIHPDLSSKVAAYYDCLSTATCLLGSGFDDGGHGTAVAGIASAVTNNTLGIAGVGYNTKLLSVKVLDQAGVGYVSSIVSGVNQMVSSYGSKKVIINLSLYIEQYSQTLETAIDSAWTSDFLIVSAAGNDGYSSLTYPAAYANVIGVGAVDRDDARASYSNHGAGWVDLAAPGGYCTTDSSTWGNCVLTTYYSAAAGADYAFAMGTSIAAPHVSGAAALVWNANPSFSNSQIRQRLFTAADAVAGVGLGEWKYGRINVKTAVLANITSSPAPTSTSTPSPQEIGLAVSPASVDAAIPPGASVKVLDLTSTAATAFSFYGYPTSYGPGINWAPSGGGILPGSTIPIDIWVNNNVPLGTYSGTGRLRNQSGQEMTFPVTVQVVLVPTNTPFPTATLTPLPTITSTPTPVKQGDINNDSKVNILDLSILLSNFGASGSSPGDINNDGTVNIIDLSILLSNFGK